MADEVLPAEFFGIANALDRRLAIGGLELPVWTDRVAVYIRRRSSDLSIVEVEVAAHDGPKQEDSTF